MGVQGLWKIVGPVARPITLESLEDKRLAIDASIWLYQFQMAMRDRKTGDTLHGAHIMGTFRRVLKLLFHGIKPVFVFDGDAPMLKKRTIEKRKRRKQGAGTDLAKTAQKLLSAQLRTVVAERELNKRRKEKRDAAALAAGRATLSDVDTGEQIGDDAVYLEELDKPASPLKAARKDALRDEYALPQIQGSLAARAKMSDPRIATEEELREFIEDLRPEDLDIESDFFSTLPTEVKYEILGDLRVKTRQVNHRRVQQMRGAAAVDFSKAQISHLMERNQYTQKLLSVTDELGKSAIAIPTRVAGSRNREYVLVKQDASKGGGWVLGVKNPELHSTDPITIDTTTDESVDEHTDTDEFEEVVGPKEAQAGLPTPDVQARRALAEEAVRARFAATAAGPVADPYLDQPVASTSRGAGLFHQDAPADDEDVILQQALYESAQTAESHDLHRTSLPPIASTSRSSPSSYTPRHHPSASSSRPISVTIPAIPRPPPLARTGAGASDTDDDDLEYVSLPAAASNRAPVPAAAVAAPARASTAMDTDGEGSDAFEEVAVARPPTQAESAAAPPAPAPAHSTAAPVVTLPSSPPPLPPAPPPHHLAPSGFSRPASPARRRPSTPPPPAAASNRTLFDSMLPSDSESESEVSPRKPARARPALPLPPAPSSAARPAPAHLSASPDPFDRFEEGAGEGEVQARDFASSPPPVEVDALPAPAPTAPPPRVARPTSPRRPSLPPFSSRPRSPTPAHIVPTSPSQPAPSPTRPSSPTGPVMYEEDLLALAHVSAPLPAALQPRAPESREQDDVCAPSPVNMPSPLPLLEKAREAVQAEEADVLPATVAQLGAPAAPPLEADDEDEQMRAPVAAGDQRAIVGAQQDQDQDELFFSDWSRSPTPPPRRQQAGADEGPSGTATEQVAEDSAEWYYDLNDDEEAEALQVLEREEEAFADVMAQLRNEKIEKMRAEAEKDVLKLSEQRNVEMRNADGVTRQMAVDIKEMLILFGIPYVDAPMEAEAECASLLSRQLVDGIVTDDSDVFLFGGSRIYRNMFNESKYVECYLLSDLEREIGLDRDKLVRLAYLLGSDYTEGLPGVGPVAGRELLEEFPGEHGLERFRDWWDRVQSGKDSEHETNTSWKRRFKKGHKELILDKGWPPKDVAEAYYRPTVVESDEHFSWSGVDLDGLRFYLNRALGWDQIKTDSLLLPLIKRDQERKAGALRKQPVMTDFFDYTAGDAPFSRKKQPKYASKRLQNVVQQWKDKTQPRGKGKEKAEDEPEDADEEEQAQAAPKKKRARKASTSTKAPAKKRSTAASRKRAEQQARLDRAAANGGELSTDEDLRSDWEKDGEGGAGSSAGKKARATGSRTQPARARKGAKRVAPPPTSSDGEVE